MASLVTLDRYKVAIGETTDDHDERYQDILDAASQAVLNFTDRDFGTADVTETRLFKYDGKGVLEIDDASDVQSVLGLGISLVTWMPMKEGPANASVYSWLLLPRLTLPHYDEMRFSQNLDQQGLLFRSRIFPFVDVNVTATWGWPTVPADVQQAVIFTAQEYDRATATNSSGELAAKSVAEVAESYFEGQQAITQSTTAITGLPPHAADLLWPYKRHAL